MKTKHHTLAICMLAAAGHLSTAKAQDAMHLIGALGAGEPLAAAFDAMSQEHLKTMFLRCDRVSSRRRLELHESVPCGMVWDALLKREFGGDLDALLAWWRTHRDDTDPG